MNKRMKRSRSDNDAEDSDSPSLKHVLRSTESFVDDTSSITHFSNGFPGPNSLPRSRLGSLDSAEKERRLLDRFRENSDGRLSPATLFSDEDSVAATVGTIRASVQARTEPEEPLNDFSSSEEVKMRSSEAFSQYLDIMKKLRERTEKSDFFLHDMELERSKSASQSIKTSVQESISTLKELSKPFAQHHRHLVDSTSSIAEPINSFKDTSCDYRSPQKEFFVDIEARKISVAESIPFFTSQKDRKSDQSSQLGLSGLSKLLDLS